MAGRSDTMGLIVRAVVLIVLIANGDSAIPCSPQSQILVVDEPARVSVLQEAVNCIGGSVTAEWVGNIPLSVGPILVAEGTTLRIAGAVPVNGTGAEATIDGQSLSGLFNVAAGGILHLEALTLKNGSALNTGGAISATQATIFLNDCDVISNSANSFGGGVWADRSTVSVTGGSFIDNASSGQGGAIALFSSNLTMTDAVVEGNEAVTGGGIHVLGVRGSPWEGTTCMFERCTFLENNATLPSDPTRFPGSEFDPIPGGGAVFSRYADLTVDNCAFSGNEAMAGGGALNTVFSNLTVTGCKFHDNMSGISGAGAYIGDAFFGGATVFRGNKAWVEGGGIYQWATNATLVVEDTYCHDNVADSKGGCLYGAGDVYVGESVVMTGNTCGSKGGCIYANRASKFEILGGTYENCHSEGNGGYLFASDGAEVNMHGGTVTNCTAGRRAGAIYSSGDSFDLGGSKITVHGGRFVGNRAYELGGAFVAWGETTVVTFTGGYVANSSATYYGGLLFLEEGASVNCSGMVGEDNFAGDQGGGLYARDSTFILWSCDLHRNVSPQGAAMYLTHVGDVNLTGASMHDNYALGHSSVVFSVASKVLAEEVIFSASKEEQARGRVVQIDPSSTFTAHRCNFSGWTGEDMIASIGGALTLDSCDFRKSSSLMPVTANPMYPAVIRNAITGDLTYAGAMNPLRLVDNALGCEGKDTCGPGVCMEGELGVYCECFVPAATGKLECLQGAGQVTLGMLEPPPKETIAPNPVVFKLKMGVGNGTSAVLWRLSSKSEHMNLTMVPANGLLPPGSAVGVEVTGEVKVDFGGSLASSFEIHGQQPPSKAAFEVESVFYFCPTFEYVVFQSNMSVWDCMQCAELEGIDCTEAGATISTLPLARGYWRSSKSSLTVTRCLQKDACIGGSVVTSTDDYCAAGYIGPYCAVCDAGYSMSSGRTCNKCDGDITTFLLVLTVLFFLSCILFFAVVAVFLVGGLEALQTIQRAVSSKHLSSSSRSSNQEGQGSGKRVWPVSQVSRNFMGTSATPQRNNYGKAVPADTPGTRTAGTDSISSSCPTKSVRFHYKQQELGGHQRSVGYVEEDSKDGDSCESMQGHRFGHVGADGGGEDDPLRTSSSSLAAVVGLGHLHSERSQDGWQQSMSQRQSPSQHYTCGFNDMAGGGSDSVVTESDKRDSDGRRRVGLLLRLRAYVFRLPLNKLKILVVVWQILSEFPSITAVPFPPVYAKFLSAINIINLDLGSIVSASCMFRGVDFYDRLLVVTLTPLALMTLIVSMYLMVKKRLRYRENTLPSPERLRAAFSRHAAVGLLLTFLVFSSVSTVIFKTFSCDTIADTNKRYLREDYSISCDTEEYQGYRAYASIMVLVYPVGIPLLYFWILWRNRSKLNPKLDSTIHTPGHTVNPNPSHWTGRWRRKQLQPTMTPQQEILYNKELQAKVSLRKKDPDLAPSLFLWKDFGPSLYYYEVVECGRRILLTGALVFIEPQSATQTAVACVFSFLSLLGFELLRPHLDEADASLYRLGCIIIFFSNFLALLIRVDLSGENSTGRDVYGILLVMINIFLLLAVWSSTFISVQKTVDDTKEEEHYRTVSAMMGLRKQCSPTHAMTTSTHTDDKLGLEAGSENPRGGTASHTADIVCLDSPNPQREQCGDRELECQCVRPRHWI